MIAADDRRVVGRRMSWPVGGGRMMKGYQAEPARARGPLGTVLVIHENRGLNAHIEDVARRAAIAGYRAVAPDFLSGSGGTPEDQDAARAAIGKLDLTQSVADAVASLNVLRGLPGASGKVGAVGFCWGGAMVNRIAAAGGDALDAGVPFYGSGLDPALAPRVEAAMLLHYAGLDERVNGTGLPWAQALKAAGRKVEWHVYDGVNHAFHNDTSAERFNEAAAKLAWQRTLDWFGKELA
jgi:carboxymethylenebutenolidase